ncbi:hypothetical protein ACFSQD_13415 [Flavihumibacter stibioxidans]|uniref:Porin n=1 Tax=Flavihumibacter stibioxidans TaxID=1834163 RepID=A0ABR7M9V1_9BACT|nr:hypothetical protein [Flavihumibacter stibioxidans]MBC6491406.1 hypothetical protein [Flavihumibacter stibioxidans]
MKTLFNQQLRKLAAVVLLTFPILGFGQDVKQEIKEHYGRPSNWRPYDKSGINMFETSKQDSTPFEGARIRFGAGFSQTYQNLDHENGTKGAVPLYQMGPGFNLAQANLNIDFQLADGIRVSLENYMSARHHNEFWVKGGYIQFDKLPFKGKFWQDLMEIATIKIGHFEVNYGDQHFRRSDGGNTIYNPFIENYIVDAFSTEIGGEVYLKKNGFFGMVGVTNGTINSSINKQGADFSSDSSKYPALYLKAGVDKQITEDFRLRFTGSYYLNNKSQRNVLYAGDRTGSNYFAVMETKGADLKANFTSGRFAPGFSRNVRAIMLNGFAKYKGLELFGTIENAKGNAETSSDPDKRTMNQLAIDGVYRIGAKENLFVGARYNNVSAEMPGYTDKVKIDRFALSAGWFLTKNILLKGEIVNQNYKDFKETDIKYNGKFNGYVIQAVIGF